ncbi:MAG: LysM peptidoglycan-binding domain-containing protein [Anaerolineaceae bacterium]|nr:LysM peptidoglycan-binding domain-containing protein [Anaerolineaceae bacterium]
MSGKDSPQNVIESYRKRQQMTPYLVGGLAVLLVAVGVIILVVWFSGPNHPAIALFASQTPTPTNTFTPSPIPPTFTPTDTVLPSATSTTTITPTPQGPFEYTVKDGDTCYDIAKKFNVNTDVLLAINNFAPGQCPITATQKILVPAPNQALPSETPLPTNLARGTKMTYVIQSGDTLALIAAKFNTTVDQIMKDNKITNANQITAGQTLSIIYGLVTPTQTRVPTSTAAATSTPNLVTLPTATATP